MRAFPVLFLGLSTCAALAAPPKPPAKGAKPPAKPPAGKKIVPPASRKALVTPLGSRGGFQPGAPQPSQVPSPPPKAASQLPDAAGPLPTTLFQTNLDYDPRIDLKTDLVAVHKHGAPWGEIDGAIQSWRRMGYPVHRMFFAGSDAGGLYTTGKADGTPHPGDVEMDASGKPITLGDRPYMVPTAGWLAYLKEHIRRAIDAGAEGIWPEEPLLHAAGGYSPAFKAAWQEAYGAPWEAPHSSPTAFFKASRVKSDLYLRGIDELLRYTKEYAREKGRDVKFFLPVHSPISYASSNLVFPHATASRLPLDGVVAQVWTGPASSPVTYQGRTESQYFESSWMLYSYFANLMEGVKDRPLYFLADPVEDDPKHSWAEYEQRYKEGLAASLLFPQARGYEVMPWPDRIYLPGSETAGGTPAPVSYLTLLSNVIGALKELPHSGPMEWNGGTRGIGVVTLDTLMWQRGGPSGSSMRSLHGLVLPLLKAGIPAEIVPGERVADKGYLSRFKVLLLSYDMQKPLGAEVNQWLAEWVKAGGVLLVVGGEDAYNQIGEWWNRDGFAGPTDHLLRACGAPVEVPQRAVRNGATRFQEVLKAEGPLRAHENRKVYRLPVGEHVKEGKPLLVRFTDLYPQDGWGPWLKRVRVLSGDRVRADFTAGTVGERPFLAEDVSSQAEKSARYADGDASFTYRFGNLGPDAVLELEMANQFQVSVSGDAGAGVPLQPAAVGLPQVRVAASYPLVSYPLSGAEPLYRVQGEETAPAWAASSGAGAVIYCGVPAAFGAESTQGGELVRALVKQACARARLPYAEGPITARRGPYVIAHSLGQTVQLKGRYVDLFRPDLPLVENPQLPYRLPGFYKEVKLTSRVPVLLHGSNRARVAEGAALRTRLLLEGPRDTQGVLRIYAAGMSLTATEAVGPGGQPVAVEARAEGPTVVVRYPQNPAGINLTLRWARPEARLTK